MLITFGLWFVNGLRLMGAASAGVPMEPPPVDDIPPAPPPNASSDVPPPAGPAAGHPERLYAHVPLTAEEQRLWAQLR
jgi:hypothetical protein